MSLLHFTWSSVLLPFTMRHPLGNHLFQNKETPGTYLTIDPEPKAELPQKATDPRARSMCGYCCKLLRFEGSCLSCSIIIAKSDYHTLKV